MVLMGLGTVIPTNQIFSQTVSANSSTAFPILSFGMGARAVGMGESFTAVADDLSALHYNSAGLAQIQQPELALTHNIYLIDGFYDNVAGLYPMGSVGTLALGINYLNYGSINQRDIFGNLIGTYTPFDFSAEGGFGFLIDKDVSLGLASQWIRQEIDGVVHTGLLWDMGFWAKPFDRFSIGFNMKNLGVETGGYNLPADFLWGAAYRFNLAKGELHSLLVSAGGDLAFQGDSHLNSGFEYAFQKSYFLRAGYSHDLQDNQLGGMQGLDFGAGARVGEFQFDYSFSFEGDLGNIQRFGLSIFFEPPAKASVAVVHTSPVTVLPGVGSNSLLPPPAGGNNPVMLKFQVTSQDDLTPQQLFDQAEEKLQMGLKQEALDLYMKAVEKDPHFEKAWSRLGRLYFDKSLESYRKVLELDPNNDRLKQWLQQYQQ
jgi:tetratricopeptide (TPR) repeat protein